MKKTFVSLLLVLVLTLLLPAPVMAAGPQSFSAAGSITSVSAGTVLPAGNSDRWRVIEREVTGSLSGGGLDGAFTLIYRANVASLETQAGNFHGRLTAGANVLEVNGKSEPIQFVTLIPNPNPNPAPGEPAYLPVFKLVISGHFTFIDGAQVNGTFAGWANFIPTPGAAHIGVILDNSFSLSGKRVK